MPKIIRTQNKYGIKFPYQEGNLLRIMESEEEPTKKYLWKTPGGYIFVYCDGDWKLLEKYLKDCGCADPKDMSKYTTLADLEEIKQEILSLLEEFQLIDDEKFRELEERILAEENKVDNDTLFDDSAIRALIQEAVLEHNNFITATPIV